MVDKKSVLRASFQELNQRKSVSFHREERASDGASMCTFPDGSGYIGFFKNGFFHGEGIFRWPDGGHYRGQWENDMPHGKGSILLTEGYCYQGQWKNGKAWGLLLRLYSSIQRICP